MGHLPDNAVGRRRGRTCISLSRGFRSMLMLIPVVCLASCGGSAPPAPTIGTGSLGGNYYAVGHELSKLAADAAGRERSVPIRYETSAGSIANINDLAAGKIQFGIAQADHQYWAVTGQGPWSEAGPQTELRSVFGLYDEYVTVVAADDSGIRTLSDLKGRAVDIGTEDTGTRRNAEEVLDAAGIDWQNDIRVSEMHGDERLSAFMKGDIDAFFFTTGHPSTEVKFATYSIRGVRLIPLVNVDALVAEHPYYSKTSIAPGIYPEVRNTDPIDTVAVKATLLTSASVPKSVVYAFTKHTLENLKTAGDLGADLSALRDGTYFEGLTAPLHPGALQYFDEAGITVPDSLRGQ